LLRPYDLDSGVKLRDLLDFLAQYDEDKGGYTLPAFPW